jgi:hypothetical protein
MRSPNLRRISRNAGRVMSGANISDPAAAAGTTVPSIALFLGGPPHATYPFWLSEAVIPQTLSV